MPITPPPLSVKPPLPPRIPGTSLHRQMFLTLRDQIVRGVLPVGSALPKEEALCEQFGVSRITVRRALADLAAQELVQRRHGLGTFVQAGAPQPRQNATLGFLDGLRLAADETQVRVLNVESIWPAPDVAALLQLAPGEKAVHALRLRSASEVPLMLTEAWVPARLGKRISKSALEKKAMYELLMSQGIQFGRVVQEISAETASPDIAMLLQTEAGAPLLRLVRLLHDSDARPIQYLKVFLVPERSRILMDIQADSINSLSAGHVLHDAALLGAVVKPRARR